ncbi:MAG TPA: MerR family DNA-binding transcriptional regulator, partial [Longimicrobiales bacterium]
MADTKQANRSDPASYLSPRELAEAVGVSESSLKRWADRGVLAVERTAGGHRRIPLGEAVRFIRRL